MRGILRENLVRDSFYLNVGIVGKYLLVSLGRKEKNYNLG